MWLFICIIDIESEMYTATTSYGLVKYNEAGPAKQLLYPVLVSFAWKSELWLELEAIKRQLGGAGGRQWHQSAAVYALIVW